MYNYFNLFGFIPITYDTITRFEIGCGVALGLLLATLLLDRQSRRLSPEWRVLGRGRIYHSLMLTAVFLLMSGMFLDIMVFE